MAALAGGMGIKPQVRPPRLPKSGDSSPICGCLSLRMVLLVTWPGVEARVWRSPERLLWSSVLDDIGGSGIGASPKQVGNQQRMAARRRLRAPRAEKGKCVFENGPWRGGMHKHFMLAERIQTCIWTKECFGETSHPRRRLDPVRGWRIFVSSCLISTCRMLPSTLHPLQPLLFSKKSPLDVVTIVSGPVVRSSNSRGVENSCQTRLLLLPCG